MAAIQIYVSRKNFDQQKAERFFKERGYEFGTLTSTGYICHHNTANIRRMILKKRAEKAAKTAKAEKQKSQAAHTGDSLKLSN